MDRTRRTLIQSAALGAALAGTTGPLFGRPHPHETQDAPPADKKLKLLILGGTGFLGPHVVQRALDRGHEMTLFNRGRTNNHLFPDLEKLRGDRDGDLKALEGRKWDAVVDTSGYVPRLVTDSADLLKDAVDQYVFISTLSVFASNNEPNDETAAVGTLEDETVEQITGTTYGPLKALCEQAAEASMPGRVSNIRPGLIVGPGDSTDRWTYWPVRIAEGGNVLAPGDPSNPVQIIDARDLANFIIHSIEAKAVGIYNAIGPAETLTMGSMLDQCKKGTASDAEFTWVDADFLSENGVRAWQDMPAWVAATTPGYAGFGLTSRKKAIAAGLEFRPISETARDTVAWYHGRVAEIEEKSGQTYRPRAGLSRERETEVLAAWAESKKDR